MIRYSIVLSLICHLAMAQSYDEKGFEVAMNLRNNVVRVTTHSGSGYGLIVSVKRDVAYVVTARNLLQKSPTAFVNFYGRGDQRFAAEYTSFRYEDLNLSLLKVNAPIDLQWEKRCYTDKYFPNTRIWYIGMERDWFVPRGSLTGSINEIRHESQISVDIPYGMQESLGAPLVNESGIFGLILRADGKEAEAISLRLIRHIVKDIWEQPYDLEEAQQQNATTNIAQDTEGGECNIRVVYSGYGTDLRGNELPMNIFIKTLHVNGRQVYINDTPTYPILLEQLPCGKVFYELKADVTNGYKVWRAAGSGEVTLDRSGTLYINWAMDSQETVVVRLTDR